MFLKHSLAISIDHAENVTTLPLFHNDPFDRILISQAIVENLQIILSRYSMDMPKLFEKSPHYRNYRTRRFLLNGVTAGKRVLGTCYCSINYAIH